MRRKKALLLMPVAAVAVIGLAACADRDRNRTATSQTESQGEASREGVPGAMPGSAPVGGQKTSTADRGTTLSTTDRSFVTKAYHGNQAEMDMARQVESSGARQEVKDYARKLREDHEQANEELKRIADQSQTDLQAKTDQKHEKTADRFRNLTGEKLDREFLNHAVKEHQADIREYQRMSKSAQHPELKTYASNTLPKLQEHLRQAQELQRQSTGKEGSKADRSTTPPR
ncbi:MAG TPA: DUF4142 domain-containing protein [Bryobacteraceae bacterium]|nr:DUF4142 domain-containing protein [Bryobacteraceae bacterium]